MHPSLLQVQKISVTYIEGVSTGNDTNKQCLHNWSMLYVCGVRAFVRARNKMTVETTLISAKHAMYLRFGSHEIHNAHERVDECNHGHQHNPEEPVRTLQRPEV